MHPYLLFHSASFPEWLSADVIYTWITMALVLLAAKMAASKIQEVPRGAQNVFEFALEFIRDAIVSNMGRKGLPFMPLITGYAFFILFSNLMGLLPGFHAPTAGLNTTVALAIIVFLLTHYHGVKAQGFGHYIKHFAGPVPAMAPLMFPIEIVSHLTRPVSLSLRLFGNIQGHDIVLLVMLKLAAFLVPVIVMGQGIFVAFIQTIVFCLLTMVYIGSAMEEAEEHHEAPVA